jgi:CobQ-like glutamine amidotransferase family enzyme
MTKRSLRVAVLCADLLGTYGDGGNGVVLARRAAWRGVECELIEATARDGVPPADLYCLGGGEDGPQVRAAEALIAEGSLGQRVAEGAVVLAVCAGFQIAGLSFPDGRGEDHEGLGLLDVVTRKGSGQRCVGEVVVRPDDSALDLPALSGFENHSGITELRSGALALGEVVVGVGNGAGPPWEGARRGSVVGTYLHGPVLARNPALADLLLEWALGATGPLAPLDDEGPEALRAERLAAAGRAGRP